MSKGLIRTPSKPTADFPLPSQDKLGTETQIFFCIYSLFTLYNQTNKVPSISLYTDSSYYGVKRTEERNNSFSSFTGAQV